jgi:biofilm protein TabA
MIVGSLTSWEDHSKFENHIIVEAMEEIKKIIKDNPAEGRTEIRGSEMYASVMEFNAKSVEDHLAEKHETYIDIHYLIEGEETIGWSPLQEGIESIDPYNSEEDYAIYAPLADEILLPLKPGMFAVFFPHDIHRPGMGQQSTKIKKIVVKVHVGLLSK